MNATKQNVALAAKMYECHEAAKRLLGDQFHERMEQCAKIVRGVADHYNCNDIVAGATIIKEAGLQGIDSVLMMAAVVEMVEPSRRGGSCPTQS